MVAADAGRGGARRGRGARSREADDAEGGDLPRAAGGHVGAVPPQFQEILASQPDPLSILRQRGALPGLGAIRRLAGGDSDASADAAQAVRRRRQPRASCARCGATSGATSPRSTASATGDGAVAVPRSSKRWPEVYSAPVLAALGAAGPPRLRRARRRPHAGRAAGSRCSTTRASSSPATARWPRSSTGSPRAAPSGRFVARAPEIWTVTLAREDGRWRFVRGIESATSSDSRAIAARRPRRARRRRCGGPGRVSRPTIAAPAAAMTTLVSRSAATGAASARSSAASTST